MNKQNGTIFVNAVGFDGVKCSELIEPRGPTH